MKNSKKIILFLLILFSLFIVPISKAKAEAYLTCSEIPVDFCPSPGRDAKGNACRVGYLDGESGLKCLKVDSPKACGDYIGSECPDYDDYGDECTPKYVGGEYTCTIEKELVYEPLKTCGEYTYEEGCPSQDYKGNICTKDSSGACYVSENKTSCSELGYGKCKSRSDCKWLSNTSGSFECYSIIEPTMYSESCDKITSGLTCQLRTDCNWLTNSSGHTECFAIINPTETSESCDKITSGTTCQLRTDCEWMTNSKGVYECFEKIEPTESSLLCKYLTNRTECALRTDCEWDFGSNGCVPNGTSSIAKAGSGLTEVDESFKCSDVKYLTGAWLLIRIAGPFIIILFGSLDFFKSMVAGDEKKMKESRGKFIKRLIAFGLFIILPFVVQFIFSVMGTYGSENVCLVKCIVTNDTSEKGCE